MQSLKRFSCPILVLFFFVFNLSLTSVYADEAIRGITSTFNPEEMQCVGFDPATVIENPAIRVLHSPDQFKHTPRITAFDDWVPVDTISNTVRIPAGGRYILALDGVGGNIEEILPPDELTDLTMRAIARAPRWLRADLMLCLNKLSGELAEFYREIFADIILEAEEPYVDEIAFTIAHISPDLWSRGSLNMDLIEENAQGLYNTDEHLQYVRIVDHGSVEDDNYWSTLEYNVKTADGDTSQVEIDPEHYYWYVVHPRISDEPPLYINPATGQSGRPPQGVFWRDYLMNHADDGYPLLSEMLEDCEVLWSNLRGNGTAENGAIGIVNQWILESMEFGSRQERPIQPVRIYHLHLGRCGEHQDLTAAVGRAALIPVGAISCHTNDHVWNEFYDGTLWWQWEPVNTYIADSLVYERWSNGTWRAPGLFKWRGDGFVENVTSRYCSGSGVLIVEISDDNRNPVDGARISIYSEYLHGGYTLATFGFTDSNGEAIIRVGAERNIYLRVDSEAGRFPANQNEITQVIRNVQDGQTYSEAFQLSGECTELDIDEAENPDDPVEHYHLLLNYEPLSEITCGRVWSYSTFFANLYPAKLDFFICDEKNYQEYLETREFEAFSIIRITEPGEVEFTLPSDATWYAVFSNDERLTAAEDIRLEAFWSRDEAWSVPESEDKTGLPDEYALMQNYPNPFNAATRIDFALSAVGNIKIAIFDLNSRQISSVASGRLSAGYHSVQYDASDLKSGVYAYRMECNGYSETRKMILVK